MKTPKFNPHAGASLEAYGLVTDFFASAQPDSAWQAFSREQKQVVFKEVLLIFSNDNGAVSHVEAEAAGWPARGDIFRCVFRSLPEFRAEEVSDELDFFLAVNDYVDNPVVQEFLENELPAVFLRWGVEGVRFSEKALLEKEFYHLEAEPYRLISAQLFQLGAQPEHAAAVEELYLKILSRWEWNHPLVNADAIEALSLRKSAKALPLIQSCFAADLVDERILRFNHVKKNYGPLMPAGRATKPATGADSAPPVYAGDDCFGRLLFQAAHLDIGEARLMTVAKLVLPLGPRLPVAELLEEILFNEVFSEEDDDAYKFYNTAETERFVGQLMGFWNENTRYRQEFLPLEKPLGLSTIAFFNRAALFFGPFLDLLEEKPAAFKPEQKVFLETFLKLDEEQKRWMEGLMKRKTPVPKDEYRHPELEQRLQELWAQGYLGFVRGWL